MLNYAILVLFFTFLFTAAVKKISHKSKFVCPDPVALITSSQPSKGFFFPAHKKRKVTIDLQRVDSDADI